MAKKPTSLYDIVGDDSYNLRYEQLRAEIAREDEELERKKKEEEQRRLAERNNPQPAPEKERGLFRRGLDAYTTAVGATHDAVQGGLQRIGAGLVGHVAKGIENPFDQLRIPQQRIVDDLFGDKLLDYALSQASGQDMTGARSAGRNEANAMGNSAIQSATGADPQILFKAAYGLLDAADANQQEVTKAVDSFGNPIIRQGLEAVTDVLGSLSSAASLVGGPVGAAVGGGDVYMQQYIQARNAGLSHDEAEQVALAQGGVAALTSVVPMGIGKGVGFIGNSAASRIGKEVVLGVGKEGTQEVVQTLAEQGMWNALKEAAPEGSDLGAYAENNLPKDMADLGSQLWRSFKAGALMGGVAGGAVATWQDASESGRIAGEAFARQAETAQRDDFTRAMDAFLKQQREAAATVTDPTVSPFGEQMSLFPDSEPGPYSTVPEDVAPSPTSPSDIDPAYLAEQRELARRGQDSATAEIARLTELREQQATLEGTGYEVFGEKEAAELAVAENNLIEYKKREQSLLGQGEVQTNLKLKGGKNPKPAKPTDIQTRGGDTYYRPDGTVGSNVDDSAVKEASKFLSAQERADTKAKADALKAATAAHTKSRNSEGRRLAEESRSLPEDQRARHIADGLKAWDVNNRKPQESDFSTVISTPATGGTKGKKAAKPLPTVGGLLNTAAPTATTTSAPVTPAAPAVDDKTAEAIRTYRDMIDEAEGKSDAEVLAMMEKDKTASTDTIDNLNAVTATAENPSTARELVQGLAKKVGQRDSRTVLKLVADGKVVVHNDNTNMPNDDGTGIYVADDGKIHINASKIEGDNFAGKVLHSVATHETNHAANVSGNKDIASKFRSIIGDKAMKNVVKKVEAAAGKNDPIAREIMRKARMSAEQYDDQSIADAVYELEVNGYAAGDYTTERAKSPAITGALRDMLSAARTKYRSITGNTDIDLADIAYLSRRVTEEAARTTESLARPGEGRVDSLNMVIDKNISINQAANVRRMYESGDGFEKYLLSDKDSKLKSRGLSELEVGGETTLGNLLEHKALDKEIGTWWHDLPVLTGAPSQAEGMYDPSDKLISVSSRVLNKPAELKEVLLHELQHGLQDKAKRSGQFFDYLSRIEAADKTAARIDKDRDYLEDVLLPALQKRVEAITGDDMRAVVDASNGAVQDSDFDNSDDADATIVAQRFLHAMRKVGWDNLKGGTKYRFGQLEKAANSESVRRNKVIEEMTKLRDQRMQDLNDYRSNLTEAEAHYVQQSVNKTQEELDALGNPEDVAFRDGGKWGGKLHAEDSPRGRKQAFSTLNAVTLPADVDAIADSQAGNVVVDFVKKQGLYHSGLGKDLFDRIGFSVSEAAAASQEAITLSANIDRGIAELSKRKGVPTDATASWLGEYMNKLADLPSPVSRERALASLVRANPELAPLQTAYSVVAHNTKRLVKQAIDATPNPTPSDLETWQSWLDNSWGYTTRMFAAHQGSAGTEYGNRVLSNYLAAEIALAKQKNPTPDQIKDRQRVLNMRRYLIDHDLTIPDAENIMKKKTEALKYLYDMHVPTVTSPLTGQTGKANADQDYKVVYEMARASGSTESEARGLAKTALADALLQVAPTINSADMQKKADGIMRKMLAGESSSDIPMYLRTVEGDRGILRKREELAPEVRAFLGELTNPATRISVTLAKQGELIARNRLMQDMHDLGEGQWVHKNQIGKFTHQLRGKGYGALEGMYTTKAIHDVISSTTETYNSLAETMAKGFAADNSWDKALGTKVASGLRSAATASKVNTVVLDAFAMAMNAGGSVYQAVSNGTFNPKYWVQGGGVSLDLIKGELLNNKGQLSDSTLEAIKYGVVDNAKVNELKDGVERHIRDQIKNTDALGTGKAKQGIKYAKNVAAEVFAQSDVWAKIAAFKHRTDILTNLYEAEGVDKSRDEILREAAVDIKDTNISVDRVPPFIRNVLEPYGLTTFANYFWNVPRSLAMSTAIGLRDVMRAKDMTTTEGKVITTMAGAQRLLGVGVATAGNVAIMKSIAAMLTNDEEEERIGLMQKVMDGADAYSDLIYLGKDEGGVPKFFNLGRLDPYGVVNDVVRMALSDNVSKDELLGAVGNYVVDLAFSNRATKLMFSGLSSAVGDTEFKDRKVKLEKIFPDITGDIKAATRFVGVPAWMGEFAMEVVDTLYVPGTLDALDPTNTTSEGTQNAVESTLNTGTKLFGGRLTEANVGLQINLAAKELKELTDEGRKYTEETSSRGRTKLAEIEIQRADERAFDVLHRLADIYVGATDGVGMSKREVIAAMKEAKIPADFINSISRGRVPETIDDTKLGELGRALSKKSMDMRSDQANRHLSAEGRDAARKALEQQRAKLKEQGAVIKE